MNHRTRYYTTVLVDELPDLPQALCKGLDIEAVGDIFFPLYGVVLDSKDRREALQQAAYFCGRCPEREACLEWALTHHVDGIWGGTSAQQRRSMMRAQGRVAS